MGNMWLYTLLWHHQLCKTPTCSNVIILCTIKVTWESWRIFFAVSQSVTANSNQKASETEPETHEKEGDYK